MESLEFMLNIRLPSDGQHLRQNTYEVLGNLENGLATRRIAHTEAIRNSKIRASVPSTGTFVPPSLTQWRSMDRGNRLASFNSGTN